MNEPSLQLDQLSQENIRLIQAYLDRMAAARAAADEFDGWMERINSLPELTTDCLIRMHGQLIALGYLKFELSGRNVGLRYQVSPRGKQALERALRISDSEDSEEDPCCQPELSDAVAESEISSEAA